MRLIVQTPAMEPVDIDDFGCPELFGHGWTTLIQPEVITTIVYCERIEAHAVRRYAVCRVHFPRSRWHAALDLTLARLRGAWVH